MSKLAVSYLNQYGETEIQSLPVPLFTQSFDRGVALPLRGESIGDILDLLNSLQRILKSRPFSSLVVGVINSIAKPSSFEAEANRSLKDFLYQSGIIFKDGFALQRISNNLSILWVDRFERHPFGEKEGVGLARKIGCDILLSLNEKGILKTPFLWTTDADANLPHTYFDISKNDSVALHYPYRHSSKNFEGTLALTLYEIHLRNYFLGLRWALSPFAFPSIGSCLAIEPEAYAQVRGFPKRQAGEDFHLLSKLRKIGPIRYQKSNPIILKGRFSSRVPFGTGQSTIAIHKLQAEKGTYTLYSPFSFVFLKDLLHSSNLVLCSKEEDFNSQFDLFVDHLKQHQPSAIFSLEALDFFELLKQAFELRKNSEQRLRHFHTSFDALKTLRLIHLLDEHVYKPEAWDFALLNSPFLKLGKKETASEFLEELQFQEETSLDSLLVPFPGTGLINREVF
jgi:hypothetical protein